MGENGGFLRNDAERAQEIITLEGPIEGTVHRELRVQRFPPSHDVSGSEYIRGIYTLAT